jgi:hypothetical protein
MKITLLISAVVLLLFTAVHIGARGARGAREATEAIQAPASESGPPCSEQSAAADKKKVALDHDPLLDPAEELRIRAQKKMEEKNFKEMQDAANELSSLSGQMSSEINASGQYVISIRVLDDLDRIEKLAKKVRSRAR